MHKIYLAIKDTSAKRSIPVLWTSAKTYYEENSKNANNWEWSDPWLTFDNTEEQILKICQTCPPSVFGFSIYVWNESYMHSLAKKVKLQHPDCVIVYGGPQVNVKHNEDFFKLHHWVDAVCPSDGYGEIIIKEILDNYPVTNWDNIPYVWYTNNQKQRLFSTTAIEKKSFQWPSNIYKAQEKYFQKYINEVESVILETTRGCPYKCIYCDWGGGTYTKLISKPYTTILDEIEWVAKNKVTFLGFPSANFGILPIDVDIAEYCVSMNQKYGFPKYVHSEAAKNNIDRIGKIQEIWLRRGMINHIKVSIQTLNDEIKNNIERIDIPIEKQVANVRKLQSIDPNIPIKIETILGLPGDNYKNLLDQIDLLYKHALPMPRNHIWLLLPEAPAYSPEMREKFQIGTTTGYFDTFPFSLKPEKQNITGVKGRSFEVTNQIEMVVETYSYTKNDFVDMYIMSSLALALEYLGLRYTLIPYMQNQHNISPSNLIDYIYTNFIKHPKNFRHDFLEKEFDKVYTSQYNCAHGITINNHIDTHIDFPLILSVPNYIGFIMLQSINEFLNPICNDLAKKFNDEKIIDLGEYISNSLIDVRYDPTIGRKFNSNHNWFEYFSQGVALKSTKVRYKIADTEVYLNTKIQPISWHLYQNNLTQYAFEQVLEITNKTSKTIAQV